MDDLLHDDARPHRERELTLGTGAILSIFLGLALLCGAFFGFGYNVGRKSVPTPLSLPEPADTANSASRAPVGTAPDDGVKPVIVSKPEAPARKPRAERVETATSSPASPGNTATAAPEHAPRPVAKPSPAVPLTAPKPAPAPTPVPTAPAPAVAGGSFVVQVAAVSHKEDADLLLGALRGRGYNVASRTSPADNFIHIQVGPFANKKDAEAMRQRLIGDGYNAIVK